MPEKLFENKSDREPDSFGSHCKKFCLCSLKSNSLYEFLSEATKPVEKFLVESRSSSKKLEKRTRNEEKVEIYIFWRKVYPMSLLLACNNIRITSSWKSFRNSSSVLLIHFWFLLYLRKKTKDEFCSIVWWRFIFWKTCSI